MTEPLAGHGLDKPEIALPRLVESLSQRFPDTDRTQIEQRVRSTYDELVTQANVESHLVSMTENRVTDDLRAVGERVHVRGEDV